MNIFSFFKFPLSRRKLKARLDAALLALSDKTRVADMRTNELASAMNRLDRCEEENYVIKERAMHLEKIVVRQTVLLTEIRCQIRDHGTATLTARDLKKLDIALD